MNSVCNIFPCLDLALIVENTGRLEDLIIKSSLEMNSEEYSDDEEI